MFEKKAVVGIIDFGGQYTHLIARRIRDLGVHSEIFPWDVAPQILKEHNVKAIIFSGGPYSVYDQDAPQVSAEIMDFLEKNEIPLLGLCYGHQFIAQYFGGEVKAGNQQEYGRTTIHINQQKPLFKGVNKTTEVWMSHGDKVVVLPATFEKLAASESCEIAAFANLERKIFGLQFHPEVVHTDQGDKILENFLFNISSLNKNWSMENYIEEQIQQIQQTVGENRVIIGVSGGVDSTVSAILIHKSIGDRLHCVFVDHGLMRKDEPEEVEQLFTKELQFKHFYRVNAKEKFLAALKGVSDPEKKRKIIGHKFIEIFEDFEKELEKKYGKFGFLAQGTIYPDRIESAQPSKTAAKIKSHHNVTLPEKMKLEVVEPLKELYKDEVRTVGHLLGVPKQLINRHPFPGPGLAVRILGEITQEKLDTLKAADAIFIEELRERGEYDDYWQSFAVLLPVKSVGVMGDSRTYEWTIVLRSVDSVDAMTADWSHIPYKTLAKISNRIVNNVKKVNRVVYDITSKPPATIEWE
ncbi:MAG: glutamine-hydrolyzing GMP synthase [Candidatus Heimdallarchaeota archaeon]|nr:glutamine-hydrolyzing GMP synthase [Candidatus Heimdallarchaeota archaeon]